MKKHLPKIISLIIVTAIVFVAVSAAYFFLYRKIIKIKNNNVSLSSELKSQTDKNNELDAIQKNIKLTVSDSEALNSFFVQNDSIVDFIQLVELTAKKRGLKVSTKNIEPKESEFLSSINKELLQISIETAGSWRDTILFIKSLTDLPYKINIISTDLSYGNFEDAKKEESLQLIGVKFWQSKIVFSVIKTK